MMNGEGRRESDKMTEQEIKRHKKQIDQMNHAEMASMWRFAPAGHPFFDNTLPLYKHFKARFDELGGMTTEISKSIGW